MIFTTTLCVVLTLSSTFAYQANVEQLLDEISSEIVGEMVQVAKDGSTSSPGLTDRLLNTLRAALARNASQIKQLGSVSGETAAQISKDLILRILQNKDLNAALAAKGKTAPRFVGALVLGITQIVTDVVKMGLTRY